MNQENLRVLIIDDEESIRDPLREYFMTRYRFHVEVAGERGKAMELVEAADGKFDVAVIDQLLDPGPDGIEVMAEIRSRFPDIECIIFTGWGTDHKQRALDAGAFRYLEKALFEHDELAMLIRTAGQQVRLRSINRMILGEKDPQEVLTAIRSAACSLSLADDSAIVLVDPISNQLNIHAHAYPEEQRWRRHLSTRDLTWDIIRDGRVISIENVARKRNITPGLKDAGIGSFIGIPIPGAGDESLGVLYLYSKSKNHFSSWGTIALMQTLVGVAGVAIVNALAFHQVRTHAGYMDALVSTSRKMTQAVNLNEQMRLTWEFVLDQLQISTYYIGLFDERTRVLQFPFVRDKDETSDIPSRVVPLEKASLSICDYVISMGKEFYACSTNEKVKKCQQLDIQAQVKGDPCESCFFIPLKSGDKVIGLISIQAYYPNAFNDVMMDTFRALGSHLAVTIERTEIFNALEQASQNLGLLNQVVLEIGKERGRDELLAQVLAQAVTISQADGGGIYLLDPAREFVTVAAFSGFDLGLKDQTFHPDEGITGEILRTGQIQYVTQYSHSDLRLRILDDVSLGAVAGAPIHEGDQVVGALVVHNSIEKKGFDPTTLALLQQFASHVGINLEKNSLVVQLQSIQEVTASINACRDISAVLELTCKAAVSLFSADHSAVVLFEKNLDWGVVEGEYPSDVNSSQKRIQIKGVPAEETLVHQQKVLIYHDIQDAKDEMGPVYDLWREMDIRSIVIAPVIYQGRTMGSFSLDSIGRKRTFTANEIQLCQIYASHVAVAIDNARLFGELSQRERLLKALDEASRHIRAEKETDKILQEALRLATQLVSGTAGALFIDHPALDRLTLNQVYQLPEELIGQEVDRETGLVGGVITGNDTMVVQHYDQWLDQDPIFAGFRFDNAFGIPIRHMGMVEAVLFIAQTGEGQIAEEDRDILERFAMQVAIALHTSRLIGREQRVLGHLNILHRITDTIQATRDLEKVLHIILTGVTAGYGLGFNRAALFLYDEAYEHLVGKFGIGDYDEPQARKTWGEHQASGLENFDQYLAHLDMSALTLTPVGEKISGLKLVLDDDDCNILKEFLEGRRCCIFNGPADQLPGLFVEAFEPAFPLVVVPLYARNAPIGLLITDNKFTAAPVTDADQEALVTFVSNAGVAIENIILYEETETSRQRLKTFFEASSALVGSEALADVLQRVVDRACEAAQANGVSLIFIDQGGYIRSLITSGEDRSEIFSKDLIRPQGLSMEVIKTGLPQLFEDANLEGDRVNPNVFARQIRAALCLPIQLEGRQLGVMWFHYRQPQHFTDQEIQAAQLYVNQAALSYDSSQRINDLVYLTRAADALSGAGNQDEILEQIVEQVHHVLEADSSAMWIYDEKVDQIVPDGSISSGIDEESWVNFQNLGPQSVGRMTAAIFSEGWLGVEDISLDDRLSPTTREMLSQIGIQSFQALALEDGVDKMGVLYVNYHHPRRFYGREKDLARTFANNVAMALRKARLLKQVEKSRDTAMIVSELTVLGELESTLEMVVRGTQEAIGCDAITLYAFDADREELLYPPAVIGVKNLEHVWRSKRTPNKTAMEAVLYQDELVVVEDAPNDPLFSTSRFVRLEEIQSSVGVPLVAHKRIVGVMFVNYRTPQRFHQEMLAEIKMFADQAAVAIHNAQLYELQQHYQLALIAIQEMSTAISQINDLNTLLDQITNKAARIFDAPAASVMLWDDSRSNLVIKAAYRLSPEYQEGQMISAEKVNELRRERGLGPFVLPISQQPAGNGELIQKEGIKTALVAALLADETLMGALVIYAQDVDHIFTDQDKKLATIVANHSAIAIQKTRNYEAEQRHVAELEGLNKVSLSIRSLTNTHQVYQQLNQSVADLVDASMCAILLYDSQKQALICQLPITGISDEIGRKYSISLDAPEIYRLWMEKESLIINDVKADPLLEILGLGELAREVGMKDTMLVKLKVGVEDIGIVQVSNKINGHGFSENDARLLGIVAGQMAMVIENATLYEELSDTHSDLEKTKDQLAANQAVAWMNMMSSVWRHAIEKHALTIIETVDLLRRQNTDLLSKATNAQTRLVNIEKVAAKILEKPITPPMSSEEDIIPTAIHDLVKERTDQLWKIGPYNKIHLEQNFDASQELRVRISSDWLRRALDILIDNAVEVALPEPDPMIRVSTRQVDKIIEIEVADNGPGFRPDIQELAFRKPIRKEDYEKGMGLGLLMAKIIIQANGGETFIKKTSAAGSKVVISLPLVMDE